MKSPLYSVLNHAKVTKEPVAYVVGSLAAVYTFYEVVFNGKTPVEVLGENQVEAVIAGLAALLTRASVYAPKTVTETKEEYVPKHARV